MGIFDGLLNMFKNSNTSTPHRICGNTPDRQCCWASDLSDGSAVSACPAAGTISGETRCRVFQHRGGQLVQRNRHRSRVKADGQPHGVFPQRDPVAPDGLRLQGIGWRGDGVCNSRKAECSRQNLQR